MELEKQLNSKRGELYIDDQDDFVLDKNNMSNSCGHEKTPKLKQNIRQLKEEQLQKLRME